MVCPKRQISRLICDLRTIHTGLRSFGKKTGRDAEVDAYLAQDEAAQAVMRHAKDMLSIMLDRMAGEGRPAVTIAFGCTGGQHRSVWAAETIVSWLRKRGHEINLHHRELDGSA